MTAHHRLRQARLAVALSPLPSLWIEDLALSPAHVLRVAIRRIRKWLISRRTRLQLAALDDRMLRDIGLTRADVAFWAETPKDDTRRGR